MSNARLMVALGLGLACLGVAAAQGGHQGDRAKDIMHVRLEPTRYNIGRGGFAALVPAGNETAITLNISGVPDSTSLPIHFYSYLLDGSCSARGSVPRRALTGRVLAKSVTHPMAMGAAQGPVQMSYRVARSFDTLRTTPFAISVRLGPADGGHEIFCGNGPR